MVDLAPFASYWQGLGLNDLVSDNAILIVLPLAALGLFCFELLSRMKDGRLKNWVVACIGAGLLGWLDFQSLIILVCLALAVFSLAKAQIPIRKVLYWLVLFLMAVLIGLKDNVIGLNWPQGYIPLGVSYYFFRLMSFIIEYAKGSAKYEQIELDRFMCWVFFFPTFIAGPILRYHDFEPIAQSVQTQQKIRNYGKFWLALLAKLLLVDHILLQQTYSEVLMAMGPKGSMALLSLFGGLALLHAYLDMMLYTAMSQAVANYLGYTNVENFNKPFLATNISQYWLRWHMSLSSWTKDYIFFPTLIKTRKAWLASYASMMIIGLWHGATLNWVFWALMHGTAINVYSFIKKTRLYSVLHGKKSGRIVLALSGWTATMYFVSMAFIFIAFKDFKTPFLLYVWCIRSWGPVGYILDSLKDASWYLFIRQLVMGG
jgi:D-alanyl-lipoteichoic acid acyltransferase DltB (MBOAT superfamily)